MYGFTEGNTTTEINVIEEAFLIVKIRDSYIVVYRNKEGEFKNEFGITAQEIFDYSKYKLSKKNDI